MITIAVTLQEAEGGSVGITLDTTYQKETPPEKVAGGLVKLVLMQLNQMIEGEVNVNPSTRSAE